MVSKGKCVAIATAKIFSKAVYHESIAGVHPPTLHSDFVYIARAACFWRRRNPLPYIASDIAQQMALSQIEPEKTESPFASLSERELQIMLMITKGQKVNEISEQLNLSPKTVNSYRYRMFSKLNIHGDVELTHLAIRHGLCNAETLSSQ